MSNPNSAVQNHPPYSFFKIPEIAKILKISKPYAYRLVQTGAIKSYIFGKRKKDKDGRVSGASVRVLKEDLEQFIRNSASTA